MRVVGTARHAAIRALAANIGGEGLAASAEARYLSGAGVRALWVSDPAASQAAAALNSDVTVSLRAALPPGPQDRTEEYPEPQEWLSSLDGVAQAYAQGALRALALLLQANEAIPDPFEKPFG
jgi:hypothetical protein